MVTLNAYAKLNLSLDILGKRQDGYHNLDTIMQNISLCDTLTIDQADSIRVHFNTDGIDIIDNTAFYAAKAFLQHTKMPGANIKIQKCIPTMSGLGGASADAAAVIIGLDKIYGTHLDKKTLLALGKSVGADVPFALFGGMARVGGIGDKLKRLTPQKHMYYTLVKPHQGVSTAQAFSKYRPSSSIRMDTVEYAVLKGDAELFSRHAGNVLGMAALGLAPDIMQVAAALKGAGAGNALMSGSGSTMFSAFETMQKAQSIAEKIKGDYELCGAFAPKDIGVEVIGDTNEPV